MNTTVELKKYGHSFRVDKIWTPLQSWKNSTREVFLLSAQQLLSKSHLCTTTQIALAQRLTFDCLLQQLSFADDIVAKAQSISPWSAWSQNPNTCKYFHSMSLSSWVFANIQGPEAKLQVTVYSKQVQVSGGQGLVVNAKMEASFGWTFPFWEMELKWAAIAL